MRKILFWLIFNVRLGRFAPFIMGLALGSKPIPRIPKKEGKNELGNL